MSSGTPFYSKPIWGVLCLPTNSGTPLLALHSPIELFPVTSNLACVKPYWSVNICLKTHWPGSQGSGSWCGLSPNCLGTNTRESHSLSLGFHLLSCSISRLGQAGKATRSAMLRKILRLFSYLPGKITQSALSAGGTGESGEINPPSLKCMMLNDSSVRHFPQVISTILSALL